MNLFKEESVTPFNFGTFVLIWASSVIVKLCRGFIQVEKALCKINQKIVLHFLFLI